MNLKQGLLVGFFVVAGFLVPGTALAGPTSPVQDWTEQSPLNSPSPRTDSSMVFDPASGKTVLFGGNPAGQFNPLDETWTWDGSNWTQETPANHPYGRSDASMAFDPSAGNVVLFGGAVPGASDIDDTWTWDGSNWTQMNPGGNHPSRRNGAAMAFDPISGDVVLFGGVSNSSTRLSDTWTWNGSNWTQRSPAHSPPGRAYASMAFDPSTGQMVLFGGDHPSTWTWDGSDWTDQSPATQPPRYIDPEMAFDPSIGDLVLFGGRDGGFGISNQTWTWDGSNWNLQSTRQSPPPRMASNMAFDSSTGNLVVFGGSTSGYGVLGDTWTYGPPAGLKSGWNELQPTTKPPGRYRASMGFDDANGEMALFGGLVNTSKVSDTWTFADSDWTQKSPAVSPSSRYLSAMAFDPSMGKMLLFGGSPQSSYARDTWTWDGSDWANVTPAATGDSPSGRAAPALAFDQSSGEMVLFGGTDNNAKNDTWTWNGVKWTQKQPAHSPGERRNAYMAYDESSGEIVMVGGFVESSDATGTWTWDGNDWTEASPTGTPNGIPSSLSFDPTIGKVVATGYSPDTPSVTAAWSWDGSTWTRESDTNAPPPRDPFMVAFDPSLGSLLRFGGNRAQNVGEDSTWTYGLQADPPLAEIESPADGLAFTLDDVVPTTYTCDEGLGGPGLTSCADSNGATGTSGSLDTSTLGNHTYTVTATSGNGLTGESEISYEVEKFTPAVEAIDPTSATVGQAISVDATLTGGGQPGGALTFTASGPDDPDCSGIPVFTSSLVPVAGNGTYSSSGFTPTEPGTYRWSVDYPGDARNEGADDACRVASEVTKAASSLVAKAATSAEKGAAITFETILAAGPGPSGTINFTAYGPQDPGCLASPAFTSPAVPVTGGGTYTSPRFTPAEAGTYRWRASYSGDGRTEASSTTCGDEGSISTVTDPVPPPPVCPAIKLNFSLKGFKPNKGPAKNRQVPGVLARIKAGTRIDAKIRPGFRYRVGRKSKSVRLRSRTIRVNGSKRVLFGVPRKMKRDLRRATGKVYLNKVTLTVNAKLRQRGAPDACFQKAGTKKLRTRIIRVSVRNLLRRL